MKILIVDDEVLAINRLERLLDRVGVDDIVSTTNSEEAISLFREDNFDIAYLDIEMPKLNGVELAQKLLDIDPNISIIFQTAYDNYAIESFSIGVIDYILKPIEESTVKRSLERVLKFKNFKSNSSKESKELKFITKYFNKFYIVKPEDIIYIKADLSEAMVKTKDFESYIQKRFYELEELLKPLNFFRVHRSYIVNLEKIKELESVEQSKFQISFFDIDESITSSKDGAKLLREYFDREYQ